MQHDTFYKKKLTDILNGGGDSLRAAWDKTDAAGDFAPLPANTYTARIVSGELTKAKSGTAGYKLAFKVIEGEHAGRQFWHDLWLTPAALPMTKRDLAKLGVCSLEQLEQPLPPGIRVKAKLVIRKGDDGTEYNRVKSFEPDGIDGIDDDDFAPVTVPKDGGPVHPPASTVNELPHDAGGNGAQGILLAAPAQLRSAQSGGL